jgi:hypothetical protein
MTDAGRGMGILELGGVKTVVRNQRAKEDAKRIDLPLRDDMASGEKLSGHE